MAFEYIYYRGRDRDDWSRGKVKAKSKEDALRRINEKLYMTDFTLKKSSVKFVHDNVKRIHYK